MKSRSHCSGPFVLFLWVGLGMVVLCIEKEIEGLGGLYVYLQPPAVQKKCKYRKTQGRRRDIIDFIGI